MVNKFLKAKHWQIFLLLFGLPLAFQIYSFISMSIQIDDRNTNAEAIFNILKYLPVVIIFSYCTFFSFIWSVAIGLQKYLPENIKMKTGRFKIFFFFPLIYSLLFMLSFSGLFVGLSSNFKLIEPIANLFSNASTFMLPLHLFSMFCIIYIINFTSKTYKMASTQEEVSFSDYIGEFFGFCLYSIGVWIIQPKINKIVNQ